MQIHFTTSETNTQPSYGHHFVMSVLESKGIQVQLKEEISLDEITDDVVLILPLEDTPLPMDKIHVIAGLIVHPQTGFTLYHAPHNSPNAVLLNNLPFKTILARNHNEARCIAYIYPHIDIIIQTDVQKIKHTILHDTKVCGILPSYLSTIFDSDNEDRPIRSIKLENLEFISPAGMGYWACICDKENLALRKTLHSINDINTVTLANLERNVRLNVLYPLSLIGATAEHNHGQFQLAGLFYHTEKKVYLNAQVHSITFDQLPNLLLEKVKNNI